MKATVKRVPAQRIEWMDTARALAIILVVFCHAVEYWYGPVLRAQNYDMPIVNWIIQTICFIAGRLGVPLFLMLTGALLLSKDFNSDKDVLYFYKKSFFPLIICVEMWNILNRCFYHFFYDIPFSCKDLLKELLFLQLSPLGHMWYMPMILGVYLVIPFLAIVVQKFESKVLFPPLCIVVICNFILPILNKLNMQAQIYSESISFKLDMSFMGGTYGVYLILGYWIVQKDILKKISDKLLLLVFGLSYILLIVMQYYLYVNQCAGDLIWYSCLNILILGAILFEELKRYGKKVHYPIFRNISIMSLGIYFLHKPILMILKSIWKYETIIGMEGSMILFFFISFIISYFLVELINKNKILSKYLLNIKNK